MVEEFKLHCEFLLYHSSLPVIGALVAHKIPSHLQDGPKTAEELASIVSVSSSRLFRFLRLASYFGVFTLDSATQKWENTPKSLLLATPTSQAIWAWHTDPLIMDTFIHSQKILSSDQPPHIIKGTPDIFELLSKNAESLANFQNSMTYITKINGAEIINSIEIDEGKKVLDVGGADGTLVLNLVKKYKNVQGGVFDRPEVSPIAIKNISENGLSDKVQFHGGSFFDSITEGYDCIVMKHVIHDWADDFSLQILKNCRKVLKEGDKLFVVDQIIDKNSEFYHANLVIDYLMMILCGSKERTVEEFEKLFNESGFRLNSVKKAEFEAVIEAIAV